MNGRVITDFDQTPLMSTYLVAFIVSDFKYTEYYTTNGSSTAQRVITRNLNQTSYALTESIAILNAIEKYLQVSFPLSKLDQAAIPGSRVGGLISILPLFFCVVRDSIEIQDETVRTCLIFPCKIWIS